MTLPADVQKRLKEYIEYLYAKDEKPDSIPLEDEQLVDKDDVGPPVLFSEVDVVINELKRGKATGIDDTPFELLIADLCSDIYNSGIWPENLLNSIMIPLEKKINTSKCEQHRTVSLIMHAATIMLKILTRRIEGKAEEFLGEDQFGFRRGRGSREAIAVMRVLVERCIENDQDLYVCYVDYEKAFDRVRIGVDWKDRRLISALYMNQKVKVRVAGGESGSGIIGRGVR